MITIEQAKEAQKLLDLQDQAITVSTIRFIVPVNEEQANNLQSHFASIFGSAILSKGNLRFNWTDKNQKILDTQMLDVWTIESTGDFKYIKRYLGLIKSWATGIKIISNAANVALQIDNFTYWL